MKNVNIQGNISIDDVIKNIIPHSEMLSSKSNHLIEKFKILNLEVQHFIQNEKDLNLKEITLFNKKAVKIYF